MSNQTSIYEMREIADLSEFHYGADRLITPESVEQWPHRDIDELRAAAASCESITQMADELESNRTQIVQWGDVYGVDLPRRRSTMAAKLQQMDASEVSGD